MVATDTKEAALTTRFGVPVCVRIPYRGQGVTPKGVVAAAQAAEEAGFDAGFVGDHVVWPKIDRTDLAPPSPGHRGYPHSIDDLQLESLTVLSFVAAATTRLKIGTCVLIPAYRPPVLLAKQVASLDFLSEGRVILGLGAGWLEQEFQTFNVPFTERGKRLEETIEILRCCWNDPFPEHHGKFWDFGPLYFHPQPKGRVPIWMGGHTEAACRRAVRIADGWFHSPTAPLKVGTLLSFLPLRPPEKLPLEICMQYKVKPGTESDVPEVIARLRDEGATRVFIAPWYDDESPKALLHLIDSVAG